MLNNPYARTHMLWFILLTPQIRVFRFMLKLDLPLLLPLQRKHVGVHSARAMFPARWGNNWAYFPILTSASALMTGKPLGFEFQYL